MGAEETATGPVKVLYILGWGRSGSTILDNVLGQVEGFFTTGEMHYLWDHLQERRPCGCGRPIDECPVWSHVSAAVLNGSDHQGIAPSQIVQWQRDHMRLRHTLKLITKREGESLESPLDIYASLASSAYQQVARQTGARVIIDSTKRPTDAALLRLLPKVDPYVVHLVRDPRAVAYSWQRRKQQLDRPTEMDRYDAFGSSLNWLAWNLAAEVICRRNGPGKALLLRYEDFITHPEESVRKIVGLVRERATDFPFVNGSTVQLELNHSVAGNPRRFKTGQVKLYRDDEWRAKQGAVSRVVATTMALPLLRRYHYRLLETLPSAAS